jgi:hypothetical protein
VRAASNERIAQIRADNSLSVVEQKGKLAAEKTGATLQDLNSKAAEADQAAADASAAGDEQAASVHRQVAASYRDAVQRATTFAGATPSSPKDKSQDPRPSPKPSANVFPEITPVNLSGGNPSPSSTESVKPTAVAPTVVDPKATKVSIGGKDYPIFVDKNGNRAYKVDGHFVPIQSQ